MKELGATAQNSLTDNARPATSPSFVPPVNSAPRSSNLGIRKEFSDRDKDFARGEGIQFLSRFFENSLQEICARNPELEQDFHQKDADSFEASLYQNGQRVCHCGIWKTGGGMALGDICYSQAGVSTNSCNDAVTLEDDGTMLGFRSMMGGMSGYGRDSLLTCEGVAEYFWDSFIRPIK